MKNESFLDFVRTSLRKCHAENVNQLVVAGRRACRLLLGQLSLKLIEDIFLRYIDQPDDFKGPVDNEEFLYQSLKHLKNEGEMVDKIGSMEVLERKLRDLNRQKYEAQDKLRSYNPDMTKILSIPEAHLHQQFVMDAIRRIEKLKKAKLLEKEISPSKPHNVEIPIIEVKDSDLTTEESVNSKRNRNQSADDQKEETRLPTGPHLSISYLKTQKNWNLQNAEDITSRPHVLEV
ncbi:PREDICTED: uncharacterized protein LOC18608540 [Theobroma cacao]|uniref:Uncharacterized protein LOC18608540 n=1 Tax=Theobroma cacao TaxID=3641 RepID=A0AB32VZE5_THECC|nr:PREDICTED: uncharacterized protein LOC18608540 [Theobroma cacao]